MITTIWINGIMVTPHTIVGRDEEGVEIITTLML